MVRVNPEKVGIDGSKLSRIDSFFQRAVGNDANKKEVPGIGVRIIRQGKIAFDNCYGFADIEQGLPMTQDTIVRAYSMTKPIVSAAALKLYEQGAFSLDEPIKTYIPSFSEPKVIASLEMGCRDTVKAESDITIKQLFTMTSGLSYGFHPREDGLDALYEEEQKRAFKSDPTTAEFIDMLAQLPLAFHPGTDYRYSFSIDVLGRLIEVLSGKTLGDFLESELFIPLGMNDTGFFIEEDQKNRLAGLYDYSGEKREKTNGWMDPFKKPSFESGGGGLLTTMDDYSRFCEMLLNGGSFEGSDLLGRKTVDLMSANHLEGKAFDRFYDGDGKWGGKRGYGYGLGVRTLINPAKAGSNGSIGEFGWDGAASTWMMVDPGEEISVLYMVQMFPYGYVNLRDKFVQMVYAALR